MPDVNDMALVREYADLNSEPAFAELVRRHINLVYSVALRFTGNTEDAQDVTQAVFIILAQKAAGLRQGTILTGWLYETTRFTAMKLLRTKARQQAREQEAYMQSTLNDSGTDTVWRRLAPILEEAMARLNEKERTLLALRFFENKSGAETAALLGIQEWAAHKRTARAVEKLRVFFAKRGVVLPAAVLTAAISASSVQAAPVALAKTATAVAITKGATASGSTLTLIKGALKLMAWTKAKTAIVVGVGMLLAAGTATFTVKEIAAHHHEVWQEQYDLLVTDRVPPQVKILPSATRSVERHVAGENNGKILGLGKNFPDVMLAAYGWKFNEGQLIFSVPVPAGQYDFISNLPQGQSEALQQEIKKNFGLIGRREMMETNVLVLKCRFANAAGLRRNSDGKLLYSEGPGLLMSHNQTIFALIQYLRRSLGTLVVDQTGLNGDFDIDLKWDSTPQGLKQELLDQLGLEVVPTNEAVEFLVVERAK